MGGSLIPRSRRLGVALTLAAARARTDRLPLDQAADDVPARAGARVAEVRGLRERLQPEHVLDLRRRQRAGDGRGASGLRRLRVDARSALRRLPRAGWQRRPGHLPQRRAGCELLAQRDVHRAAHDAVPAARRLALGGLRLDAEDLRSERLVEPRDRRSARVHAASASQRRAVRGSLPVACGRRLPGAHERRRSRESDRLRDRQHVLRRLAPRTRRSPRTSRRPSAISASSPATA